MARREFSDEVCVCGGFKILFMDPNQGVQRIVVFMVNKSKKYRLWSNICFKKQTEFSEIESTSKYVSWHYILMSLSAGCGEIMQCFGEIARIS